MGLENFTELEREKWRCNTCGGTVCVHRGHCLKCNLNKNHDFAPQKLTNHASS